jgi:uncharacterized protein YceK
MNILKNWGRYGIIALLACAVSGCGQINTLTTGADETTTIETSHSTTLLSSTNSEWTLTNGNTETLSYTNNSTETVTLTFNKMPISGKISYTTPSNDTLQELQLGILSSLATYSIASGDTQTWTIEGLPDNAANVVLTLVLIVNETFTTETIQLN